MVSVAPPDTGIQSIRRIVAIENHDTNARERGNVNSRTLTEGIYLRQSDDRSVRGAALAAFDWDSIGFIWRDILMRGAGYGLAVVGIIIVLAGLVNHFVLKQNPIAHTSTIVIGAGVVVAVVGAALTFMGGSRS